jgi:hypothetical protein
MIGCRCALAFLGLVAALTSGCASPRAATEPGPERPQLFLLAGQSNMAGRGVLEAEDRVPHPRVLVLDRNDAWVPAVEPLHFDKPIAGVGPGRAFGIAVAEALPEARIGLIPAAVGGSPITAWAPGVRYAETGAYPYDDAIRRARIAMRDGELKAILWHQGESDANAQAAPLYAERLRALVERFRADLGVPDLPVIVGQIGRFEGKPWSPSHEMVDAAHRALPSGLPNVRYVSADGLAHKGDTLHFSAPAARELGRRYAEAYLTLERVRPKR